jgi:hypothetical protein
MGYVELGQDMWSWDGMCRTRICAGHVWDGYVEAGWDMWMGWVCGGGMRWVCGGMWMGWVCGGGMGYVDEMRWDMWRWDYVDGPIHHIDNSMLRVNKMAMHTLRSPSEWIIINKDLLQGTP